MKVKSILNRTCSCLLIGAFAFMALASGNTKETKEITNDSNATSAQGQEDDGGSTPKSGGNDFTIEEQVLIDQDGIKITAKSAENDSIWGRGIKLLIQNTSDRDYALACDALIVNDYMITDLFASQITAGMSANETMYLSSSQLEAAGIDKIGKIEMDFHIYDPDSYQTLFSPDTVTIETSLYDEMDTTPNDSGTELYNANNIRIVGKYVDENSFWGAGILLYIENNSDTKVTVQCESIAINGFMVDGLLSCEVYPGKKAIDDITIFSSDLEKNDITSIDDISLSFRIFNSDSYNTIDTTDQITFSTH